MQRWKHAGRGPKSALLLGILLGMASLLLFQAAYAAEPPYPGPPGLPGIPNGPSLGCSPTGATNSTWVCGFDALSSVSFIVNHHAAGTSVADSNGCVLVVVTFLKGEVSISGNAAVPVKAGLNFLVVQGYKTTNGIRQLVGLRLPFSTPAEGHNSCNLKPSPPVSTTTAPPSSGSTTTIPGPPTTTTFPVVTTSHPYYPTTLAKAIETPLRISPNKVILESSLLAAVLAAALSAGALGAIWAAGERGSRGATSGGTAAPSGTPPPPSTDPTGLGAGAGGGPGPSPGVGAPPGGGATSAFSRPTASGPPPGGEAL